MINVRFDFIKKEKLYDSKDYIEKVKTIDKMIKNKTGEGSDFLGWTNYASRISNDLIQDINNTATYFKNNFDILVICGIGGSYLGSRALIEAINGLKPTKKTMEVIYLGNTLDPNYIYQELNYIKNKKFAVCVISKSGTTIETSLSFRLLKEILVNKLGKEYYKAIVAITDKENGLLKKICIEENIKTFDLPRDIGGRYSCITPVGLFPLACCDINIEEFLNGVKSAQLDLNSDDLNKNEAYKYAVERYHLYTLGYKAEMLAHYNVNLTSFSEWWKQLFGESEGKDNKGLLPTSATFTTDLHSLGQFIQDGSKILFETVLYVNKPSNDVTIPYLDNDNDELNYLSNKTLSFIDHSAFKGTLDAHSSYGEIPNIYFEISELSTFNMGYLVYFFMKACAMSAYLLNINPFNQPGVEIYKKNMFHLLKKKGY